MCVIDVFSKYAWVAPLKNKKGVSNVNAFQSILKKSNRKPNKIWVDPGSEFYNNGFKKWLKDNNISMYSTHNEGKSDKLFAKWKGYDNSFNSWIDKKDLIKLVSTFLTYIKIMGVI